MSDKDQDGIGKEEGREEVPGRRKVQEDEDRERDKSGIDKLIDKAQEKGVFDKAAKIAKDRFGGDGKKR